MLIQEMTEAECLSAASRGRLARLACAHENQPYIVPIYFAYEKPFLYGFTTPGQKVEWMRSNPLVCVELDEIVDSSHWMSIIIFGRYEELPDLQDHTEHNSRRHAHELLRQHADWWELGSAARTHHNPVKEWAPVYYRVHIDRISGRRVTSRRGGPTVSAKLPLKSGFFQSLTNLFTKRRK